MLMTDITKPEVLVGDFNNKEVSKHIQTELKERKCKRKVIVSDSPEETKKEIDRYFENHKIWYNLVYYTPGVILLITTILLSITLPITTTNEVPLYFLGNFLLYTLLMTIPGMVIYLSTNMIFEIKDKPQSIPIPGLSSADFTEYEGDLIKSIQYKGFYEGFGYNNKIFFTLLPIKKEQLKMKNTIIQTKSNLKLIFKNKNTEYVIGNIRFNSKEYELIFIKKKYENILTLDNTEQRAVAIQEVGIEKIMKHTQAESIDKITTISKITNKPITCELLRIPINDWRVINCLKVECHTTHKKTFLGVPNSIATVKTALAWTFNLNSNDYTLTKES